MKPITLEEYNKKPYEYNAAIQPTVSILKNIDIGGANPNLKNIRDMATALYRKLSSINKAVIEDTNKLLALVDSTVSSGTNLSGDQKDTLGNALAPLNKLREAAPTKVQESPQPSTPEYKKKPGGISPEKWDSNHKAIKEAAKQAIDLASGIGDNKVKALVADVGEALSKDNTDILYPSLVRLQAALQNVRDNGKATQAAQVLRGIEKPLTDNQRSSNGKTMESPPKAKETPPKPEPGRGKLCEPITYERWGVRFRFLEKPPDRVGKCESNSEREQWDMKDWFLQLLPAMQSVIPRQGARDVPNAGPGLSFRFKNNMVKHKIPGGQPVYQMMGVDSAIITFVGTFTGDGGLGYINKVDIENGELAESAKKILEQEAAARRAGEPFKTAIKYGGEYPYGGAPVNAMFNPIYHVRNRALAPGGDTSSALVGSNSTGWLIDNSILRSGFFERDGCPGQCPPPSWGKFPGHIDEAGGKVAWGDFGVWPDGSQYGDIGTRSQMDTHKLAYIAAYLDAYHEMVSFYKFAVQAGKLMEITINLRKSHDGLKPRIADPRMKGKFKSDTPDPLRDMHTGNPTFKGYLRSMNTWAQYSDRVWYVMEFEVVDHGLQGKKAVNLTNKVGSGGSAEKSDGTSKSGASGETAKGSEKTGSEATSTTGKVVPLGEAAKKLREAAPNVETKLKLTDGRTVTLYPNGAIADENEGPDSTNTLSYDKVKGLLGVEGLGILDKWRALTKVNVYQDSDWITLVETDGTRWYLNSNGTVEKRPLGGKLESVPYTKVPALSVDGIQKAALDEWRAAHPDSVAGTKAESTPSTSPSPKVPGTKPDPSGAGLGPAAKALTGRATTGTLTGKDGTIYTLHNNGQISTPDRKYVSYLQVEKNLNWHDLLGKNKLNTWFDSTKVTPVPSNGSIYLNNGDGTIYDFRPDGTIRRISISKDGTLVQENVEGYRVDTDLSKDQGAAIDEWWTKHGSKLSGKT